MQDDEAMDRGIDAARYYGKPFYVLDVDGWQHDQTGRFPAIPPTDGFTKPSSKNCSKCGDPIASAEPKPLCAMCEILLSGDMSKIMELSQRMQAGEMAYDAAKMIVYGTTRFWDCVYGRPLVPVEA